MANFRAHFDLAPHLLLKGVADPLAPLYVCTVNLQNNLAAAACSALLGPRNLRSNTRRQSAILQKLQTPSDLPSDASPDVHTKKNPHIQ